MDRDQMVLQSHHEGLAKELRAAQSPNRRSGDCSVKAENVAYSGENSVSRNRIESQHLLIEYTLGKLLTV